MIVLIPLSRFRVKYDLASGRPYSRLEGLILRAIADGYGSVDSLCSLFKVPSRLVIESVVTLIQEGWVAIGSEQAFLVTGEGQVAIQTNKPPTATVIQKHKIAVFMERLSGGLILSRQIKYFTSSELQRRHIWENSFKLRPHVNSNSLDQGDIQHLLPRDKNEWLRWVGPIDMETKGGQWLPVNVDLSSGTVSGLPTKWLGLAQEIIDEVSVFKDEESFPPSNAEDLEGFVEDLSLIRDDENDLFQGKPVRISAEDLLFSAIEHNDLIHFAFQEATKHVLITSAFVRLEKLKTFEDDIRGALAKGVHVDLLWGYDASNQTGPEVFLNWLKKLSYATKGMPGNLYYNLEPTGSHAKVIGWTTEDGTQACVGSFNWLSASHRKTHASEITDVSLRIREPSLLASIYWRFAGILSRLRTGSGSIAPDRLSNVAIALERHAATANDEGLRRPDSCNAHISIVADAQHSNLMREQLSTATRRVLICSHQMGAPATARLRPLSNAISASVPAYIFYGESLIAPNSAEFELIKEHVSKPNRILVKATGLHAKVLVCDDSACISSYNYLSADAAERSKDTREMGVLISGAEPTNLIWERFATMFDEQAR